MKGLTLQGTCHFSDIPKLFKYIRSQNPDMGFKEATSVVKKAIEDKSYVIGKPP